ncbi:MAG: hypothetical protein GY773_03390 [Actinomycetia bacterium]|nr:hypothetical protein [Actinomycetes bacterium]
MSPLLVVLIVVAAILIMVGIQVSATQIQRFPVDNRNPGPVINTTRQNTFVVRPAELEHLHSIVAESLSSEAIARVKLRPLLDELDRMAPGPNQSGPPRTGYGRRGRPRALEHDLDQLEARWDTPSSRTPPP